MTILPSISCIFRAHIWCVSCAYVFCIRVRVEYAIRAHHQGSAICCCLAVVRLWPAMSESTEPSPAATREPQQQSPSTSTSAASEPQPSSTAASAASDPPRHQSHADPINLTGDGLSSEPARAVAGGIDTAGVGKGRAA